MRGNIRFWVMEALVLEYVIYGFFFSSFFKLEVLFVFSLYMIIERKSITIVWCNSLCTQ